MTPSIILQTSSDQILTSSQWIQSNTNHFRQDAQTNPFNPKSAETGRDLLNLVTVLFEPVAKLVEELRDVCCSGEQCFPEACQVFSRYSP